MRHRPYAIIAAMRVQRDQARGSTVKSRSLTILLGLIVVTVSASAQRSAPASNRAATPSFDRLYDEGQQRNAAMKTLTARFTETTTSALLVRPLVAHGMLAVERPSRVALRYSDPDARVILI